MWAPISVFSAERFVAGQLQRELTAEEAATIERYAGGDASLGGSHESISRHDLSRVTGHGELEAALRAMPSATGPGGALELPSSIHGSLRGFDRARGIVRDRETQAQALLDAARDADPDSPILDLVAERVASAEEQRVAITRDEMRWALGRLNGAAPELSMADDPMFAGALQEVRQGMVEFPILLLGPIDPGPARLRHQIPLVVGFQAAAELGEEDRFVEAITLGGLSALERYATLSALSEVASPEVIDRVLEIGRADEQSLDAAAALVDSSQRFLAATEDSRSELRGDLSREFLAFYEGHNLRPESVSERLVYAAAHLNLVLGAFDDEVRAAHWSKLTAQLAAVAPSTERERHLLDELTATVERARATRTGWRREDLLYISQETPLDRASLQHPQVARTIDQAVAEFEQVLRSATPAQLELLLSEDSPLVYRFEALDESGELNRYSGAFTPGMVTPSQWHTVGSPLAVYDGPWGTDALDVFVAEARYRFSEGVRRVGVEDAIRRAAIDRDSVSRHAAALDSAWSEFTGHAERIRGMPHDDPEVRAARATLAESLTEWAADPTSRRGVSTADIFERLREADVHLDLELREDFDAFSRVSGRSRPSHPAAMFRSLRVGVSWPNLISLDSGQPLMAADGVIQSGEYPPPAEARTYNGLTLRPNACWDTALPECAEFAEGSVQSVP
ncbi:MAG: hypothetical protein AAFZ38_03035 [Myxococcota bacterium]